MDAEKIAVGLTPRMTPRRVIPSRMPAVSVISLAASAILLTAMPSANAVDAKQGSVKSDAKQVSPDKLKQAVSDSKTIANDKSKQAPSDSKTIANDKAKLSTTDAKAAGNNAKSAEKGKQATVVAKKRTIRGFVPPPPPVVPTLSGDMSVPGELIDLMSERELVELKTKLETEFSQSTRRYTELLHDASEAGSRSTTFDQLYSEGVISRRELEATKREAERLKEELKEVEVQRADIESRLDRTSKKLATRFKKATKSASKK